MNVGINSMKETSAHDRLIRTIRTAITEKENLTKSEKEKVASVLGDILCLGKESVYRRLRGEVRFSFEEVAQISQALGFSVDNIIGSQVDKKAIFELNLVDMTHININYAKRIEEYVSLASRFGALENSTFKCAFNSLPFIFFLHYDSLAKFRLFKWSYQIIRIQSLPYKDFTIEKELTNAHRAFVSEIRKVKNSQIIINHDMFASVIRELNYFYDLNLLDAEDMELIKSELNEVISEIENISISGIYNNTDSNIAVYLCNIDIDATYLLLESNNTSRSHIALYGIGGINSIDPSICKSHALWIESLKRYSTLITFGGEIQRHKFFQEQRKLINTKLSTI
ncbi:helix-turn-helix domain-containing protein [uncultured Dysgonomonas sp.]|uniref:Uncharacterized protein n=1 Tax=uncultured Dysgonomonas sp. TaxID=206096 RepID=A0A212K4Y5_9BACT|nr:helix-turn-helix domain-containing protein [uncultured Dysgonomonas sp.]SBW06773.1 conserved hypothetical protein [uncultured Dysgonomonas sp.]